MSDRASSSIPTRTSAVLLVVAILAAVAVMAVSSFRKLRPARPDATPVEAEERIDEDASVPPAELRHPLTVEEIEDAGLTLHPARYWSPAGDGLVRCELCPRMCLLRDTERGECRVRVNADGELFTLVYGAAVASHVDPIEKKPLFHFLPGTDIVSVATAGCNLRCRFCQNWTISQTFPEATRHRDIPPEALVQAALDRGAPSIAFTYTEPTIFYEYMLDTARAAHERGVRTVSVTCGSINEKPLRELAAVLDAANVDLKGFSEEFYEEYCGASLRPVLDSIVVLHEEGVHVEITNLLIPGGNDDPAMIRAMCEWIVKTTGPETPLHFSRYHPAYKMERPAATPVETLRTAAGIAKECGLKHVYLGNIRGSEGSDTFCPNCGKLLVQRWGFSVRGDNIVDGRCPFCHARVNGVWSLDEFDDADAKTDDDAHGTSHEPGQRRRRRGRRGDD